MNARTFDHGKLTVTLTRSRQNPNCYWGRISGSFKGKGMRGEITQFVVGIDELDYRLASTIAQPRRTDNGSATGAQCRAVFEAVAHALSQL